MSSVKLTLTVALQRRVRQGLCAHGIEHSDTQEVCGSRGIVTALVLKFTEPAMGRNSSIDFLPDSKYLSGVESLHSLIFSHGHIHNCIVQVHSIV